MAKYTKSASTAARGQRSGQRARATRTKLTTAQRAEKRAALAAWRLERDALFTEYKLTARTQGRGA
jgi:hypothetical protein